MIFKVYTVIWNVSKKVIVQSVFLNCYQECLNFLRSYKRKVNLTNWIILDNLLIPNLIWFFGKKIELIAFNWQCWTAIPISETHDEILESLYVLVDYLVIHRPCFLKLISIGCIRLSFLTYTELDILSIFTF